MLLRRWCSMFFAWGVHCVFSLQILGLVGSARKRTLVLWQAVEFSRAHEMAITNTLQVTTRPLVTLSKTSSVEAEVGHHLTTAAPIPCRWTGFEDVPHSQLASLPGGDAPHRSLLCALNRWSLRIQ